MLQKSESALGIKTNLNPNLRSQCYRTHILIALVCPLTHTCRNLLPLKHILRQSSVYLLAFSLLFEPELKFLESVNQSTRKYIHERRTERHVNLDAHNTWDLTLPISKRGNDSRLSIKIKLADFHQINSPPHEIWLFDSRVGQMSKVDVQIWKSGNLISLNCTWQG